MKKSKQAYYDKYFERNWNNIKNTQKGIKSLISLKTVASHVSTVLSLDNGNTITNPYDTVNTFNNYFASIAEPVLGPLLFLLYINDPNQVIKFCKVHHFADDTNLLCLSNSIKKLKKLVNADLKHLANSLNTNKISLNVNKN